MSQKCTDKTRQGFYVAKITAIVVSLCLAGGIAGLRYAGKDAGTPTLKSTNKPAPFDEGTALPADREARHESQSADSQSAAGPSRVLVERQEQADGSSTAWAPAVPADAREAANTFRRAQNNAFFDEEAFARSFASQRGSEGIEALRDELKTMDTLAALPDEVDFMRDAPPEVLDRMSVIDMLGTLAADDPQAIDALVDIVNEPLNGDFPPAVVKVLVGEKYDAFVELARHDWSTAAATFSSLQNEALKDAMRPALIGGLVDVGTSPENAMHTVNSI